MHSSKSASNNRADRARAAEKAAAAEVVVALRCEMAAAEERHAEEMSVEQQRAEVRFWTEI